MQGAGLSTIEPNTVMLEYPSKKTGEEKQNFTDTIKYGIEYKKAVVVLKPG